MHLAFNGGGGGGGVTLTSIAVTPTTPTSQIGHTVAFTAIGTYSNSSTQNITSAVLWASNDTSIVTMSQGSAGGIATCTGSGTVTVSCSLLAINSNNVTWTVVGTIPFMQHFPIPITHHASYPATTQALPFRVPADTARIRLHMRNFSTDTGVAGDDVTGVDIGVATYDGNGGYSGSPTKQLGVTIPGGSYFVSQWFDVSPGVENRVMIAFTVPGGFSVYESTLAYCTGIQDASDTPSVDPLPTNTLTNFNTTPFFVGVETETVKPRIIVLADSIGHGYSQYWDAWPDPPSGRAFPIWMEIDQDWAVDGFGVDGIKLQGYVDNTAGVLDTQLFDGSVVVVEAGINDLSGAQTLAKFQAQLPSLVATLQSKGVSKIVWCTQTPALAYISNDAVRIQINNWLRASLPSGVDALFDADATMRDPSNTSALLPLYDSGDGVHLSPAGAVHYASQLEVVIEGVL